MCIDDCILPLNISIHTYKSLYLYILNRLNKLRKWLIPFHAIWGILGLCWYHFFFKDFVLNPGRIQSHGRRSAKQPVAPVEELNSTRTGEVGSLGFFKSLFFHIPYLIVWDGFIHGFQPMWDSDIFSNPFFQEALGVWLGPVIYHQKNTAPNLVHYSPLVMPLICFCSTKISEKIVSLEESTNQFRRPRLLLPEFPYRFRLREIRRSQHWLAKATGLDSCHPWVCHGWKRLGPMWSSP